MVIEFFRLLEDVFFPARCLNCQGKVARQALFCVGCRRQLMDVRLLHPRGYGCKNLRGICVLYSYERGVKKALHKIKFAKTKKLLPRAAEELQETCCFSHLKHEWDLPVRLFLVPVPTDKGRQQERGYDVPTGIFKTWGEQENLIWYEALQRNTPTLPQYGLTRRQRRRNVRDCFSVQKDVRGRDIILVDDIFTSGATVEEAAKTLKKAGAKKIWAITFAGGAQV